MPAKQKVTFLVEPDLLLLFRVEALKQGLSYSEAIAAAIGRWVTPDTAFHTPSAAVARDIASAIRELRRTEPDAANTFPYGDVTTYTTDELQRIRELRYEKE